MGSRKGGSGGRREGGREGRREGTYINLCPSFITHLLLALLHGPGRKGRREGRRKGGKGERMSTSNCVRWGEMAGREGTREGGREGGRKGRYVLGSFSNGKFLFPGGREGLGVGFCDEGGGSEGREGGKEGGREGGREGGHEICGEASVERPRGRGGRE